MSTKFVQTIINLLGSFIVLAIIGIYTHLYISSAPYSGFVLHSDNSITAIFDQQDPVKGLQEGDILIRAGNQVLQEAKPYLTAPLFEGLQPGDIVDLQVIRGNQELDIKWMISGTTTAETVHRLSLIWIPYVFWLIGTATALLVQPRDSRQRLLVAFNYFTAIWIVAGIASSGSIQSSSFMFRVALWISIPVYLGLHWEFPRPLGRIPRPFIIGLWSAVLLLLMAEAFFLLPSNSAMIGLMIAVVGSILLLVVHGIRQPDQRPALSILGAAFVFVTIPILMIGVLIILKRPPASIGYTTIILPIVPLAYFTIIYRKNLGGLELRNNRTISYLLYGLLLLSVFVVIALITNDLWLSSQLVAIPVATAIVLAILISISVYPSFQRMIERYILGVRVPPDKLIENYTNRIITSLDEKRLVHLLKEEVFPSLLIRQGSLLRLFGSGQENSPLQYQVLYKSGITNDQLPRPENIPILLEQSGKLLTAGDRPGGEDLPCSWARLALPLCVESNTMGICLLGRRDPDDYYSPAEIQALQVIMNQTALALVNIDQAERLRALHQYDIDRQETERNRLARDLHDDVLGQMAMLAQSLDDDRSNEKLLLAFQNSVDRMREIIDDLRPSMLNFGLRAAIDELVDELMARQKNGSENSPQIVITIPPSQERYPLEIELHMYRIVQQACYNAYKHANPQHIYLRGNLESHLVDILIQDDGDGFEITNPPDFNDLLANKHFGLAGMYERAALIRGHVNISSSPTRGTSVRVTWSDSETG